MARPVIPGNWDLVEPLKLVPPRPGRRKVWYKPNNRSFGLFIKSEQMRDVTYEVARDVAIVATASFPAPSGDTPAAAATPPTYEVKREAGFVKVGRNVRVRVIVEAQGEAAMRAEFGHRGAKRYRTLAEAASRFGDWKPVD